MSAILQHTDTPAPRGRAVQPFDVLDSCHRQVLIALQQMNELIEHLANKGVDGHAQETARSIFMFFMNTAREHHLDEERHVFPALLRSGRADLIDATLRLQQDHGWIEEDWLELGGRFLHGLCPSKCYNS